MSQIVQQALFLTTLIEFSSSSSYQVRLVENQLTSEKYVLKMLQKRFNTFNQQWSQEKSINSELKKSAVISDSNYQFFQQILTVDEETSVYLDQDEDPLYNEQFYLSTYYQNKDLSEYLKIERFEENLIKPLFFSFLTNQILLLHQSNLIHGDIKPENIVLDDNFKLVLIDYGHCRQCAENEVLTLNYLGTRGYQPPEYFSCKFDGQKFDIFSLGVTLFYLLVQIQPFKLPKQSNPFYQKFLNQNDKFWIEVETRKHIKLSAECKDLLNKMLQLEQERISSVKDILQHEWFASVKQINTENISLQMKKRRNQIQQCSD